MREPEHISTILARWRARAEEWERLGVQVDGGKLAGEIVTDLQRIAAEEAEELLSLEEAGRRSGYSADHIGRLVREQRITNYGRKGAPLVKLSELPKKPEHLTMPNVTPIMGAADRRRIARSVLTSTSGGADAK